MPIKVTHVKEGYFTFMHRIRFEFKGRVIDNLAACTGARLSTIRHNMSETMSKVILRCNLDMVNTLPDPGLFKLRDPITEVSVTLYLMRKDAPLSSYLNDDTLRTLRIQYDKPQLAGEIIGTCGHNLRRVLRSFIFRNASAVGG